MNPVLFNIQHFSIQDGPGIRTTVFFKGCPLDCAWCHNPEGKHIDPVLSYLEEKCVGCKKCVAVCPKGVHSFENGIHNVDRTECIGCGACANACFYGALEVYGKKHTVNEILREVAKDAAFYGETGGITVSGGEPFAQYEALIKLLKALKENGYNICLETSGFTSSKNITEAAKYVDIFLYDYKLTNPQKHLEFTGVPQDKIINNLFALDKIGATVVLRCPIIPQVNDCEEHFEGIARVANEHASIKSVELMPYHPLGISKSQNIGEKCEYQNDKFLDSDLAEEYCEIIRKSTFKEVKVSK